MDYEKSAALEIAHNLEKKKTAKIFELITEHLGYEPVISEALQHLKQLHYPDGTSVWEWDEVPIVTFHPLEVPFFDKFAPLSTEITQTLAYQSHITPKTDGDNV